MLPAWVDGTTPENRDCARRSELIVLTVTSTFYARGFHYLDSYVCTENNTPSLI